MVHEMKLQIQSLADTLAEEFRKTQLFWLIWNATDPTKVLPFPTIALWIDLNEQDELSGFVRTYDRTKPEFTPPQHSIVYELDTAARYGFRNPSLDHPDVDHISDLLLQPFWKPLLQNEMFIRLLFRRYRAQHIDANKHKNDMVDFYLLILIAEREASETHEAQAGGEPE